MAVLHELTSRLKAGQNLTPEEVQAAAVELGSPAVMDEPKGAFLIALAD
jgi:anthranilate phosphoribosyltransferase